MPTDPQPPEDEIPESTGILHVSSLFGSNGHAPKVILTYDAPGREFEIQLSIAEALNHAQDVMEIAHGAVLDAFLIDFVMQQLEQPLEVAAQIMQEFRVWRAEKRL